jgi:3'-5' exoribonuclease
LLVKSNYIARLKAGDNLTNEPFLLQDVARRTTRDGRAYLLCTLRDKTGQISSVFWNVPDYVDAWARAGAAVLVTGQAALYKDALQVNITDMNASHEPDMAELLPSSERDRQEMITELQGRIGRLAEPWQTLVSYLLLDDSFLNSFANAPAARGMHHAYVGGLLEHSLSMAAIAEFLADHYPYVNKDLLLTAALLHDMGKTAEYTVEGAFSMTEDGRLVGHIVRAIVLIEKAATDVGFPEAELRHLIHLIASHHGTHEWGAPVLPKTLEAVLLHQIDLLDSRLQGFLDHIRNDNGEGEWTLKASNMFSTELRRPAAYQR